MECHRQEDESGLSAIMTSRILIVSFHAPPDPAVGGLRWADFARNLASRGWQVRIITASTGEVADPTFSDVEIQRIERAVTLQDRYRRWRERRVPKSAGARWDSNKGRRGLGSRIRSSFASVPSFPDPGRGWILRGGKAVRKTVRSWQPDVVVSTGPPHSVHLAAGLGLRGSGLPWLADFRDPWATPRYMESEPSWVRMMAQVLERATLKRASVGLTTTPELQAQLETAYPSARIEWLPNGVDTAGLPARPDKLPPGLTLTHLGSVYLNRDPTPVLQAFERFLSAHPRAAEAESTFRFIGPISPEFRAALDRTVAELGIGNHVELTSTVPRKTALAILATSHVALVLAQGQDVMVPAKIYEAVAMGVPTLVISELGSAASNEARRLGAMLHEPDDVDGIVESLGHVWSRKGLRETPVPDRVDRAVLAGELEDILESVGVQPP